MKLMPNNSWFLLFEVKKTGASSPKSTKKAFRSDETDTFRGKGMSVIMLFVFLFGVTVKWDQSHSVQWTRVERQWQWSSRIGSCSLHLTYLSAVMSFQSWLIFVCLRIHFLRFIHPYTHINIRIIAVHLIIFYQPVSVQKQIFITILNT